jgi:hypothetical protein
MNRIQAGAAFALAAGLASAFTISTGAQADIGTGIGANPLRLASRAQPGGRYHLPSVLVVNTGNQASSYIVQVKRLGQPNGHDVPASWIRFAHTKVQLRPHKRAVIPAVLTVPKHAAGGVYRSNVVVSTYTRRPGGGGAALGAAAADELSFAIVSPGGSLWRAWLVYLLLALAATGAIVFLTRRLGLHFRIERQKR